MRPTGRCRLSSKTTSIPFSFRSPKVVRVVAPPYFMNGLLRDQLVVLREATQVRSLIADELKDSTIEKVLAKSDLELGVDFLLGKRKL